MKGILLEVSARQLAERRRRGLDRWDEMWESVLHMAPAPTYEHQRIAAKLLLFLAPLLERRRRGTIVPGISVFHESSAEEDYRIPDLTFVADGHDKLLAPDGVRGGGPDAVIEVRSPNDETYEKLPFFATLGVREVIVISRDTRAPEVFHLAGPQYLAVAADREGWTPSDVLGIRFRLEAGQPPQLWIEDSADPASRTGI